MAISNTIINALKGDKEVKISQRDFLLISEYCQNKGIELNIVKKEGIELTVKRKNE